MQEKDLQKILIRYHSPVLDEITVETMWAFTIDAQKGIYKIDNIPFYGPLLAPGDLVFAEFDETEGMLTYRKTLEPSGNSVVVVVLMDELTDVETLRNSFADLGCESEGTGKRYFAMEIPSNIDYSVIKDVLDNYATKGILEYSEPCLSSQHSY